jgi:asparagine synthase (glutamine-hydrolysing)
MAMLRTIFRPTRRDHDGTVAPLIAEVTRKSLTYLEPEALGDLYSAARKTEQANLDGIFVEAGCALGGSAIVLASAKSESRPFFIYDVFGMIPPPSERDGSDVRTRYKTILQGKAKGLGGHKYYGYESDLIEKVKNNFIDCGLDPAANNITFVEGLFQDTLMIATGVALAHIDGDWYDSVMTCLDRIIPQLVSGGTVIVDDYYHWSGCRRAVDDYFASRKQDFRFTDHARLHISKI